MPVRRRNFQENHRTNQHNGLYVHSSPPRVLHLNSAYVKQLIRNAELDKLEQLVLDGQGKRILGEYSADYKTRTFLKKVPNLMTKISLLHDAVNSGRVEELKSLLDEEPEKRKKLVMAKDECGVGLLHKAVYHDLKDIYQYLIERFPYIVQMKDAEGRTAFHYTPMCSDIGGVQKLLISAGADSSRLDNRQHSAKYYTNHPQELELPSASRNSTESSGVLKNKNQTIQDGLNFKKSNIRIWIHQRNLGNLQQVMWEGLGSKLLVEHSNNPKIKKFLESVPHIMGLIKDIHTDVQNDQLESLMKKVSPPIPPVVLSGKDINGLTPLHKAVGLGKQDIVEFIIKEYPNCIHSKDNEGRTPLHYAALLKDDGKLFNFLIENGADESALDNRQKTAAYYKTRNSEIDTKVLMIVPECPRAAKESFISNFDWSMLMALSPITEMGGKKIAAKQAIDYLGNGVENSTKENGFERLNDETDPISEVEAVTETVTEAVSEVETNGNIEAVAVEEEEVEQNGEEVEAAEAPEPLTNEEESSPKEEDAEEALNEEKEQTDEVEGEKEANISEPENEAHEEKGENEENEVNEENGENEQNGDGEQNGEKEENTVTEQDSNENNEENENKGDEVDEINETEEVKDDDIVETETVEEVNEEETNTSKTRPSTAVIGEVGEVEVIEENNKEAAEDVEPATAEEQIEDGEAKEESADVESEGVIEGVVNGENEVESLNEEGVDSFDNKEIDSLIEEGNMEKLAGLVLNGEGDRLIGKTSHNSELQSFLDNVPTYMNKISRIHVAAKDGSLKDLQAALDRRKFAISKDKESPNGASPLHTAVVFGNSGIVRYLAGRFPETAEVVDDNGRTALHYAAVLKDNGHYFNLLQHLGSNSKVEDKYGHTPEYYRNNQDEFSHSSLLQDFGENEKDTEDILSDKVPNDLVSARKDLDDDEMLSVLERCYSVIHGRRRSTNTAASTASNSTQFSATSDRVRVTLISRHLNRFVFDTVKQRLTKLDHSLYDIIWPCVKKLPSEAAFRSALEQDFPIGLVAPDLYSYRVFGEFFEPILRDYNGIDPTQKQLRAASNQSKFVQDDSEESNEFLMDLDPQNKYIISGVMDCTRNIKGFELPKSLNINKLEAVERLITSALLTEEVSKALYPNATEDELAEKGCGVYYTLNEVLEDPSEARISLASNNLLIPLWNIPESERLHGSHWPYGRGVFVSNASNLAVWINVLDHVRIVTCTPLARPGNIGLIYSRMHRLVSALEKKITFHWDESYGFLTSRPTVLGNTIQFNFTIRFPNLIKEQDKLRHLFNVRSLTYHRLSSISDMVRIGNQQNLGITEKECFEDFTKAVLNILQLEKDMTITNSLHLAATIVNLFKSRKSTRVDNQ